MKPRERVVIYVDETASFLFSTIAITRRPEHKFRRAVYSTAKHRRRQLYERFGKKRALNFTPNRASSGRMSISMDSVILR